MSPPAKHEALVRVFNTGVKNDERIAFPNWLIGRVVRAERMGIASLWRKDLTVRKLCGGSALSPKTV